MHADHPTYVDLLISVVDVIIAISITFPEVTEYRNGIEMTDRRGLERRSNSKAEKRVDTLE